MAEVRRLHAEEYQKAIALSDKIFRDAEQPSMGPAFPYLFSPKLDQSMGAFVDGKLVSFMGLVPSIVRVGNARLRVYSLGSVCTDEAYRGHGFASQILEAILENIRQAGASILLVSGGRSLYTRVGCAEFGDIHKYVLRRESLSSLRANSGTTVRALQPNDWFDIHQLASERSVAYEQSVWDIPTLYGAEAYSSCVKRHHECVVSEENGVVTGYFIWSAPNNPEKQRVASSVEWGGDAETVVRLVAHVLDSYAGTVFDSFQLRVPHHDKALVEALEGVSYTEERNQGTALVVSMDALLPQLAPYFEQTSASGNPFVFSSDEAGTRVTLHDASSILSDHELVSFLFDEKASCSLSPEMENARKGVFPIPLPYTSGLNYA